MHNRGRRQGCREWETGAMRAQIWNILLGLTTVIGFGLAIWQTLRAEQLNRRQGYDPIRGTKAVTFLPDKLGELCDRRVLLLDDFVMSGDGLANVTKALLAKGFESSRLRSGAVVATRLAIANRKGPDYWARETRDFDFYFPWGRAE
jgi:hypoxanthine phosphoribosyltransferase